MSASPGGASVLVTGAAGFIGANVVRRLLGDGHEVHAVVPEGSDTWRIDRLDGLAVHPGSLDDRDAVVALVARVRPTLVFHLAAHGAYASQQDIGRMVRTNTLGTFNLLEALVERGGCRAFVHTGSSSEYGLQDHPPSEGDACRPNSTYAVTKCAATHATTLYAHTRALPAVTVRLYSVYGPWEEPTRLMPRLVRAALDGRLPPLTSPDTARDFVWIDDVVDAIVAAADRSGRWPGAVWNIGSGHQTTLRDLVEIARDEFGITPEPQWGSMDDRAWDTNCWVSDPALAAEQLGWRANTGLADGLAAFAHWLGETPASERYR